MSETSIRLSSRTRSRTARVAAAALMLFVCLAAAYFSARAGLSRLSSREALRTGQMDPADRAVRLSPSDPEAHFARALTLTAADSRAESLVELERAATLRPRDYFLWLTLGVARDEEGDAQGTEAALREAVRLAPSYSKPRWQLGNVLLREGRVEEAMSELRLAASADPVLLPGFIDVAWGASGADPRATAGFVNAETDPWRLALARYLAAKGEVEQAITLFRMAGGASDKDREELLRQLLSARRFREAYEVWSAVSNHAGGGDPVGRILDAGFEGEVKTGADAFGWRIPRDLQAARASLDGDAPRAGAGSLRLDLEGGPAPPAEMVSQLVLVEPDARYRLSFAARTEELVTGGPPLIVVSDASGAEARQLAQSEPLPQKTNAWRDYAVEFATGTGVRAVLISLRRQACAGGAGPCPVFGRLWLDDFSLRKL